MSNDIRTMMASDVTSAMELSVAANWNQTEVDWRRVMQLSPHGCRCIEDAGRVVATASLLPYGTRLAWIGMVLTRPEYRRRGLAKRLMEDAIASAERGGIRTLKLDATDEGRPLYESLGFVVEQTVERWGSNGRVSSVAKEVAAPGRIIALDSSQSSKISDDLLAQDEEAFGASRGTLLEVLSASGTCRIGAKGYSLSRPGRTARHLGPCVASSEEEGRPLIAAQLEGARHTDDAPGKWYWDLLPMNEAAVRCATEFGFTRRRTLWRMQRGESIRTNDAMVYAIAGFELG